MDSSINGQRVLLMIIELPTMFAKVQSLSNKQQDTVKDFLSAFVLKTDLQKILLLNKFVDKF